MNVKEYGHPGAGVALTTMLAPIAWGTTYVTITELLPAGRPLLVASARVVPAGIALLVVGRVISPWRPRGVEWWRTAVLALFNFGLFFPLLAVAVYRLPGGVAAAAGGLQPLLVAGLTWVLTVAQPARRDIAIACVAAIGVALVVIRPNADIDPVGVLAAVAANVAFATGVVLTKRFPAAPNRLASTAWQLLLGGLVLVPLTFVVEGAPPSLSTGNLVGFAYLSLVGTALAFVLWFNGIRRLPTAAPPLLGLASPITGAAIGWAVLGQSLSPTQLFGFVVTISAIVYGATAATRQRGVAARRTPIEQTRSREQGRAMTQHIGIVACSAEGAALCYRTICHEGAERLGRHRHPEVSLHGHSLGEYAVLLEAGDWRGVGELMLDSAEKLAAIGAQLLVCPDNTIHQALPFIADRSPLPWLHIAEVVAATAADCGYRRVGLLGTRWLVDSDVYPEKLAAVGMEVVRPTDAERDEIHRIIMGELVYGRFEPAGIAFHQAVIERMRGDGCDAVILGCTEIPLIIDDRNSAIPTLDSTRLLARAAVKRVDRALTRLGKEPVWLAQHEESHASDARDGTTRIGAESSTRRASRSGGGSTSMRRSSTPSS